MTSDITYQVVPGAAALQLKVRRGGKIIGGIYKNVSFGTYYYRPTNHSGGDNFKTIEEVKQSLEDPE